MSPNFLPDLRFILAAAFIAVWLSTIILIKRQKSGKGAVFGFRGSAAGFTICAAVSLSLFFSSMYYQSLALYMIVFLPFMCFSYILTKKIITETSLRNTVINFIYKAIAVLLIWLIALFPWSLTGISQIMNLKMKIAEDKEIIRFKEEVTGYETYADLTPFGLGIYKRGEDGGEYLWDISRPYDRVYKNDGYYTVFARVDNCNDDKIWDGFLAAKDVQYDVVSYSGVLLIIPPLPEIPDVTITHRSVYLCKELGEGAILYELTAVSPESVEKLLELPGEEISRKELAEKLGKEF